MKMLLLDDSPYDIELVQLALQKTEGLEVEAVSHPVAFRDAFLPGKYDIICSDYNLQGCTGSDIYHYVKALDPEVPFVIISGALGEEKAVEILRDGVTDYVLKDNLHKLPHVLSRAIREAETRKSEKLTVQKLVESEETYRSLVENMTEGLLLSDQDGKILFVNPSFCRITGYTRDELLGKTGYELLIPEKNRAELRGKIEERKKGSTSSYETVFIHSSGKNIDVNINAGPIFKAGCLEQIMSVITDITEKKESTRKLNEASQILDMVDSLVLVVDRNNQVEYVSPSSEKVLGFKPAELLGGRWWNMTTRTLSEAAEEIKKNNNFRDNRSASSYEYYERATRTRSGEEKWIGWEKTITPEGKIIGVGQDITQRKNDEKILVDLSQRLLLATKAVKMGVFEWNIDTDKVECDAEFLMMHGIRNSGNQIPFDEWWSSIHPSDVKDATRELKSALSSSAELSILTRIVRASKEARYININAIIQRNEKGAPVKLVGVCRDVTDRIIMTESVKRSERQIRNFAHHLNQKLEEERSHIAREIHDELGQQLVGIKIGLASLKNEQAASRANIDELLADVDDTIRVMRQIATELRPGILDSLGLVPSLQWLQSEFERKTGIKSSMHFTSSETSIRKNVATCFFRVCQEALNNIIKHSRASHSEIFIEVTEDRLQMKVRDNGIGLEADKFENPFSMGLLGMKERAAIIGATWKIYNLPEGGTCIELSTSDYRP